MPRATQTQNFDFIRESRVVMMRYTATYTPSQSDWLSLFSRIGLYAIFLTSVIDIPRAPAILAHQDIHEKGRDDKKAHNLALLYRPTHDALYARQESEEIAALSHSLWWFWDALPRYAHIFFERNYHYRAYIGIFAPYFASIIITTH